MSIMGLKVRFSRMYKHTPPPCRLRSARIRQSLLIVISESLTESSSHVSVSAMTAALVRLAIVLISSMLGGRLRMLK